MRKGLLAGIKDLLRSLIGMHDKRADAERRSHLSAQDPFARRVARRVRLGVVRRGRLSRARSIAISRPHSPARRLIPRERSDLPAPPLPFVEPTREAGPPAVAEGMGGNYGAPRFFVGTTGDPAWDALWALRGTSRDPSAPSPTLPREPSPPSPTPSPSPAPSRPAGKIARRPVAEEIGPRPRRQSEGRTQRTSDDGGVEAGDTTSPSIPRPDLVRRRSPTPAQDVSSLKEEVGGGSSSVADESSPRVSPTGEHAPKVTRMQSDRKLPSSFSVADEGERSSLPDSPSTLPARRADDTPSGRKQPAPMTRELSAPTEAETEASPAAPPTLWERIVRRLPLRRRPARRNVSLGSGAESNVDGLDSAESDQSTATGSQSTATGSQSTATGGKYAVADGSVMGPDEQRRTITGREKVGSDKADTPEEGSDGFVTIDMQAAVKMASRSGARPPSASALVQTEAAAPKIDRDAPVHADVPSVMEGDGTPATAGDRERAAPGNIEAKPGAAGPDVVAVDGKTTVIGSARTTPPATQGKGPVSIGSRQMMDEERQANQKPSDNTDRPKAPKVPLRNERATVRRPFSSRVLTASTRHDMSTAMDRLVPLPLRRPTRSHPRGPVSPTPGGKVVQRTVRTGQDLRRVLQPTLAPVVVQTAPAPSPLAGPEGERNGPPDVDALAREVYRIIRRRLRIESERERGRT